MLFTDKRKVKRSNKYHRTIVEYKGDDGVWYPVADILKMIPLNVEDEMLTLPSLHNRLNVRPFNNPDILLPKHTTAQRIQARSPGLFGESAMSKLSNASRAVKIPNIKVGTFETGELK